MKICVKKGLDIPLAKGPVGDVQSLPPPQQLALNLDPFDTIRFKLLIKQGDRVKIGQPLVESKTVPGQLFVSPAGGVVQEIRRGLKRRLLGIVIQRDEKEEHEKYTPPPLERDKLLTFFAQSGLFPHIRMRPFDKVASAEYLPRAIFVRAIESLPFVPPAEMQLKGHESAFQKGLDALGKIAEVHLVYREAESPFSSMKGVCLHTAKGPHPVGNASVHIQAIAPIQSATDYVWTLGAIDVITIGKMILEGHYFTDRIVGIGGSGILEGRAGYVQTRMGCPITSLIANRIPSEPIRLISGDPLTGTRYDAGDFLGFYHTCFSALLERTNREFLHFFRLGLKKYSATRAYLSGHVSPPKEGYSFTTNQHGEERAFIDGRIYDRVMPLKIPTMHLIKAILGEDFETAERLGLLEVASEDFALPAFICPSKIEMIQIVRQGLHSYATEMGH